MRLEINAQTDCSDLDLSRLGRNLRQAFRTRLKGAISLALVDHSTIERLHMRFLQRHGPTDVLSFPLATPEDPASNAFLAEIVVSLDMARTEARARRIPLDEEVLRYCVHGLLHLLDYDDQTPKAARAMSRACEEIVARCRRPAASRARKTSSTPAHQARKRVPPR